MLWMFQHLNHGIMKNLGKFMYIIPIGIFGLMHFTNAGQLSEMMPDWMPLKTILVYISGIALIAAPVALIINKKAKLAMTLLGVELLSFMVFIHLMQVIGGDQVAVGQVFKDTSLAGAAFYIASQAED
jgi:putative oxidoreductase